MAINQRWTGRAGAPRPPPNASTCTQRRSRRERPAFFPDRGFVGGAFQPGETNPAGNLDSATSICEKPQHDKRFSPTEVNDEQGTCTGRL